MWRVLINSKPVIKQNSFKNVLRNISNRYIEVNEEVKQALIQNKPLVALESTIITHGLPYPKNLQCAREVEAVVREKGATPATIAILGGKVKVGLTDTELEELADAKNAFKTVKTSRRDFGYVIGNKLNGGTTVAGTLIVANAVGIRVFATGGIGGVHRMGEKTLDISADLTELGKSPVAVISCGVKSILDIPKTLEYLETQGVLVATFGNNKIFPAFYCRTSKSESPYNVRNAKEAANIIGCHLGLNLKSGLLFAVPIPEEFAMNEEDMNAVIDKAMISAENRGISGKEITPYLLSQIVDITKGSSLRSNMGLIKNNAGVAADIAVELSHLNQNSDATEAYLKSRGVNIDHGNEKLEKKQPMVIGGCVLDSCAILKENDVMMDGRIHEANITLSAGGVGRNMTEAMCKLGAKPQFLSVVGDDSYGDYVKSLLPSSCSRNILQLANHSTSQCTIIFDKHGECKMLIGDMNIHHCLTPSVIRDHEDLIRNSPLLIVDGNLSLSSIEETLKLAEKHKVPVFFEPTDIPVSIKPFQSPYWKSIKYITPNLLELREIAKSLNISLPLNSLNEIEEAALIAKMVAVHIPHVIVTMGSKGLIIANAGNASDPLFDPNFPNKKEIKVKHYPVKKVDNIINVSGAGDCLASGLIVAMLEGLSEEKCVEVGFAAARAALFSQSPVPNSLFKKTDVQWMNKADHHLLVNY